MNKALDFLSCLWEPRSARDDTGGIFEIGAKTRRGHHMDNVEQFQVKGGDFYQYPLLVKNLFHTSLAQYPDREIVYATEKRFSYREFRDRVGRLASALTALGVKPGDTVAVMDWDSHRYLECFFAIPMLGAVLHTVNIRLAPDQILYTINHAKDDWILIHEDFLDIYNEIEPRLDVSPALVLLAERDADVSTKFRAEYESLLASGDESFVFADFDENTRATTFYTTGTTGDPKGVYYSHRQLILHTLAVTAALGMASGQGRLHRDDVYMPITPMFHVHAWGMPFVATMMGLKQVYPGRYEPDRLLSLIESEGVTYSHCVPTILRMLLSSPLSRQIDLSRWKVVIGGSAMPQALAMEALALGVDVFSGYGMSETGPVLTIAQVDESSVTAADAAPRSATMAAKRCLSGRAIPLVDLALIDAEGNAIANDGESTGELVVRAPWLTAGYFRNQSASDELWRDGYLHTGDIASLDDGGNLLIQDRIKDVIKTGGEWISSVTLEDIAMRHDDVSEAAAIGIADEKWGERPLLLVVATEGAERDVVTTDVKSLIEESIRAGNISKWALPDRIEFVDTLPKTSVGKLDKKRMRAERAS